MRHLLLTVAISGGLALLVLAAAGEGVQNTSGLPAPVSTTPAPNAAPNGAPDQRAAATRAFLGLGAAPDKAAAALGAPLYQASCAFCHGPQARGAEGPNLITSDLVLSDDHGEHLAPFLRKGRPEKGMPAFAGVPDEQLKDIAEFLHQQVEEVANRGTYHVLNILVGDPAKGKIYVEENCRSCHAAGTFDHLGSRFRSPDQLQRSWIWPTRTEDHLMSVMASVTTAEGAKVTGRVTQVSDFLITLASSDGQTHAIDRVPGVDVVTNDPLAPHEAIVKTLKNEDMHNVTAYLESLQ